MKLNHQQFMRGAPINYAQARYMLHYMYEKGVLKRFYDEYTNAENYGADNTAQESLETALGRPLPEIERDWKAWVLTQTMPPMPYLGIATELRGGKVVVSAVVTNAPAATAGLLKGDTLVAVDGRQIETVDAFTEAIAECEAGDEVTVTVKRGAEQQELKATLAQRPAPAAAPEEQEAYLGLTFELRNGAVTITAVADGSPAAKAGLRAGSTVQGVEGGKVESVRDFLRAL
jgi:S1-C subfamily serine protease